MAIFFDLLEHSLGFNSRVIGAEVIVLAHFFLHAQNLFLKEWFETGFLTTELTVQFYRITYPNLVKVISFDGSFNGSSP